VQYHPTGVTEAEVIRWVGVAAAFTGTLLAAPSGTALARDRVVRAFRSAGIRVRRAVVAVGNKILEPWSRYFLSGLFTLSVTGGQEQTPTKADQLLFKLLASVARQDKKILVLTAKYNEMERRNFAQEQQAARAGARGVVLMGVGIVLTGIPSGLARFGVVGWLVIAAASLLTLLVLRN
jgi:hypothetical protein